VFAPSPATSLFQVPAAGGNAVPVTSMDHTAGETGHRYPSFLPDGRHFLFTVRTTEAQRDGIYVGDLESKNRVRLFTAQSNAVYTPPGIITFARDGTLLAQPTDSAGLRIAGPAFPVAEHVTSSIGFSAKFTASQTGMLAFYSGGSLVGESALTWYDRSGNVTGTVGPPSIRLRPAISPRGDILAEDRINSANGLDLWLHSMDGKTDSRLTFDQSSSFPVWSPDGSRILFQSYRPDGSASICQKSSTGTGKEECFLQMQGNTIPTSWSHDSRLAVFFNVSKQTGYDLWVLPLTRDRKPYPFLQTPANEWNGRLSPDSHWLAYQSDEAGTYEIYVIAFPGQEGKWQISTQGGSRPLWSRDGKELFYIAADQKMMAVSVKTGAGFEHGTPAPLFETRTWALQGYDVSSDGKRFLMVSPGGQDSSASMNVMVNWQAGLRR
jgi:Tol biopolymer transport system component